MLYYWYILTNIVVRRSKFWKSCVINRWVSTVSFVSTLSICLNTSVIHSKCRWLPATHTKYTYKHNALNLTQHVGHPLKNGAGCQPPTQSTPTNTTLIYNISSHSVAFSISLMQNFLLITCDIQCSAHLAAFE